MSRTDLTAAIIVAAGKGARAGGEVPKQFAPLAGKPMLLHAWARLKAHPRVDAVMVVVNPDLPDRYHEMLSPLGCDVALVGGDTRRESVQNAMLAATLPDGVTRALIHDAARPLVPADVVDRLLDALEAHDGAVPVLQVADTLARCNGDLLGETVPRDALVRVQTPQAFRLPKLRAAHAAWPADREATDDAQMVRAVGGSIALVQGDAMLEKVTFPDDFASAEARLRGGETRSASGFDVHRLEAGEQLWLGGVLIPHDKGLSGHSDADVALHAITDAVLGTIAAGDIGTHFPPSDPKWHGAESGQFLRYARELVEAKGGRVTFVDLTIMCEAPKIGPHRAAMQDKIAELLRLTPDRVSVKATTTERLGFTGRGEGIAAQATATVVLP